MVHFLPGFQICGRRNHLALYSRGPSACCLIWALQPPLSVASTSSFCPASPHGPGPGLCVCIHVSVTHLCMHTQTHYFLFCGPTLTHSGTRANTHWPSVEQALPEPTFLYSLSPGFPLFKPSFVERAVLTGHFTLHSTAHSAPLVGSRPSCSALEENLAIQHLESPFPGKAPRPGTVPTASSGGGERRWECLWGSSPWASVSANLSF